MNLEKGGETQVDEILLQLDAIIPSKIFDRHCNNTEWDSLIREGEKITNPDDMVTCSGRTLPFKKYLAAYLINIIVIGLTKELDMEKRVEDGNGHNMVCLTRQERLKIRETIANLIKFVQEVLNVKTRPDEDENRVPYVRI